MSKKPISGGAELPSIVSHPLLIPPSPFFKFYDGCMSGELNAAISLLESSSRGMEARGMEQASELLESTSDHTAPLVSDAGIDGAEPLLGPGNQVICTGWTARVPGLDGSSGCCGINIEVIRSYFLARYYDFSPPLWRRMQPMELEAQRNRSIQCLGYGRNQSSIRDLREFQTNTGCPRVEFKHAFSKKYCSRVQDPSFAAIPIFSNSRILRSMVV
ncbi:hypothetical protein DFH09DRAFT_1102696 [Mycena vulgaris]|nr:hypothetical protein DFH09DRAFT_1102696 [Mycena vulgaris]